VSEAYDEAGADAPARAAIEEARAVLGGACPDDPVGAAQWSRAALRPLRRGAEFRKVHHTWIGRAGDLGKASKRIKAGWTEAREELIAAFGEQGEALATMPGDVDRAVLPLLRGLAVLGGDAAHRYQQAKAERHLLDFDDLPDVLSDLLAHDARLAGRLRKRLRHVLVDEFQDTNALQWRLVQQLRGDPLPESGLFLVGDLKQAIYRFRGGDVTVFDGALAQLAPLAPVVQPFADNWRSRPAVIDAMNDLFGWLLAPDAPDRPAWEAPFEPLNPKRPPAPATGVEVLELAELDEDDEAEARFALLPLAREAALVAQEVQRRLPELPSHDGLQAAILLRRRSGMPEFARALRDAGVEHVVASGRGFFGRAEVLDVANLLAALAHEDDVVALLGALRGPLLGLEDAWLLWIARHGRAAGPRALRAGWRKVLESLDQPPGADPAELELPPEGRSRIREAATRYRRWDRLARRLPLSRLLRAILQDSAAAHLLALNDPSGQAAANLEKLVSLAVAFDREGGEGLAGFAVHLQQQAEAGADEGDAALDATAPVVLMTIHQSKGLEFPAVFLPDLGARIRHGGGATLLVGRPPGEEAWLPGLKAPIVRDRQRSEEPSLLRSLVARRDRDEEYAESRRVLYVAATRAREQMVFVLPPPTPTDKERGRDESTTWAEWLRSWRTERGATGVTWRAGVDVAAPTDPPDAGALALPDDLDAALRPLARSRQAVLTPHALAEEPGGADVAVDPASRVPGPPPPAGCDPGALARLRGIVLHGCVEDGLLQPSMSTDRRVRRALAEVGLLDADHERWLTAEIAEHLAGFRRAAPPALLAEEPDDAVFREIPFRLPLPDGRWLDGVIDALVREADTRSWRIIDYKTNRGDVGALAAHYRPQLIAYAWAAATILPDVRDDGWTLSGELLFTARGERVEVFADATAASLAASLAGHLPTP
jgi:ATP-dependent helicase/nuclease subunit A